MKTGIVLEGGAQRTIYSSGVCDGLLKAGIPLPDYTIGVSAGIAYGVSYLSKQLGRNLEVLEKYANDKRYMSVRHLLDKRSQCYYNMDFVYDEVPNHLVPFDYERFAQYKGTAEAVMTNLLTGEAYYAEVPRRDASLTMLRATCAMPLLFPIIEVDGIPCLDGGPADGIPIFRALEQGCERVIVVLTRERSYIRRAEQTMPLLRRQYAQYPNFLALMERRHVLYNSVRAKLFEMERKGQILLFYPQSTKGFSRTERNVEKIKALYQNGMDDALRRIDEIREFWNIM